MGIEIIVKGDPKASALASVLFGSAALCRKYDGNCPICPGRKEIKNNAGIPFYTCRFGLYAEKEAQKMKDGKVITEKEMADLDVHSRNYTGPETGYAFEDVATKLLMTDKKSTQ